MKHYTEIIQSALLCVLLLASCGGRPTNARQSNQLPKIFPDYIGVTIPAEIAPMDFDCTSPFDRLWLEVRGSKGGSLQTGGKTIDMDVDEWHALTRQNRGGTLSFTLYVKRQGQWTRYRSFTMTVSRYPLSDWGLTYRRIAPGYEVYGRMGIYQRCLADFTEEPVIENTVAPGACLNCHTQNRTSPDAFTFHVRGQQGATFIRVGGHDEWLPAKDSIIHGSMVYPYWHPSGRYVAYSTNKTHQSFHAVRSERIEVFDQASDVFVYEPAKHRFILDSVLMTKDHYETYPVFSPDGRTLYFCSSVAEPIPSRYKAVRYNICRITFDPARGRFVGPVDTIFNARKMGKSAIHPRPSYDGRYLMFTLADYGCFPIWHKEADNWLLDLRTMKARPLRKANSNNTDSWHNWSIGSHWFVFTSRRIDGLYTRLYLCCIDDQGREAKPFLLPQRHPLNYYADLMCSYNTPDFTSRKVRFDQHAAGEAIRSGKRTEQTLMR